MYLGAIEAADALTGGKEAIGLHPNLFNLIDGAFRPRLCPLPQLLRLVAVNKAESSLLGESSLAFCLFALTFSHQNDLCIGTSTNFLTGRSNRSCGRSSSDYPVQESIVLFQGMTLRPSI